MDAAEKLCDILPTLPSCPAVCNGVEGVGIGDAAPGMGDAAPLPLRAGMGDAAPLCVACAEPGRDDERDKDLELRLVMTGFLRRLWKCTSAPWKRPTTPSQ